MKTPPPYQRLRFRHDLASGEAGPPHSSPHLILGLLALFLFAAAGPKPLLAAGTVEVCTEAALRQAMGGGGYVVFACDGTIPVSTIRVNTNLVLDGAGHHVTLSGGASNRVFWVEPGISLTLSNLTIEGGYSQDGQGGGGIYNNGTLNIVACTFRGNRLIGPGYGQNEYSGSPGSPANGGAIYNSATGALSVDATTFCDNTATGGNGAAGASGDWMGIGNINGSPAGNGGSACGGAIYSAGPARIVNSTFAANSAAGGAGGQGGTPGYRIVKTPHGPDIVYGDPGPSGAGGSATAVIYDASGRCALTNCTLALNRAVGGVGGTGAGGGMGPPGPNGDACGSSFGAVLVNCLLAGNAGPDGFVDAGNNFRSTTTTGVVGLLADNGGPTLTMALPPGSPAIDAAASLAAPPTDQRGTPRSYGAACDVGAFESQSVLRLAASAMPSGRAELQVNGPAGQVFRLLTSTNLIDWTPLQTNQLGPNQLMVFEKDAGKEWEFYRAELLLSVEGFTIEALASPPVGGWVAGGGRYLDGYTVTLLASPSPGYGFVNWSEDGAIVNASTNYTFTAITNRTLTGNFAPLFTISVAASPGTGGQVSGGGVFFSGASVTVLAVTNSDYAFVNWTENGALVSTSANYTFTATTNRTLTANFVPFCAIAVGAAPAIGGSVSGGGSFAPGSSVTVAATPTAGYGFVNWTENGAVVSTSAGYTFTAVTNRVLTANFAPLCEIAVTASPAIGGSATGGGLFAAGLSITVVATPASGYGFVNWTENGAIVSTAASYTFITPTNRALVANFAPLYTIAVAVRAGGFASGGGVFLSGASVTVRAAASPGYAFVNWTENGVPVSTAASYTVAANADRTLTANFTPLFTITAAASPAIGGWVSGGGVFDNASNVTVVAITNSGYAFVNWTENGAAVSTSASYTFPATSNRNLTANFTPLGAAAILVSDPSEAALRQALAAGGPVAFARDGTITLSDAITIATNTVLDGAGRQVTISGNNATRVFCVNSNVHFTLMNLTVADGRSSGGSAILNLGGAVELAGVSFVSNTATYAPLNGTNDLIPEAGGGAIFNRGGIVKAGHCSFTGNSAQTPPGNDSVIQVLVYGGAIRNEAGQVDLQACSFTGNRAAGGSAGMLLFVDGDPGSGGAIHNSGTMTLDLCTFVDNYASGGASAGDPTGLAGAPGSGGAIGNLGSLVIERTTLRGNAASGGSGGQGMAVSDPNDMNGYPGGNGAWGSGGAIYNQGSLWVAASTFASNAAIGGSGGKGGNGRQFMDLGGNGGGGGSGGSGLGGALCNGGTASLVNCTLAFNTGSGGGGGQGGSGGSFSVVGSTGGNGGSGGLGVGGVDGPCNLIFCTVTGNQGRGGSGGPGGPGFIYYGHGADGLAGANGNAWGGTCGGTLLNTLTASNTPAGSDLFADAKLGPLADNSGPTPTMALLPGSPAIDAANTASAVATDQRGFPRPYGTAADLGAYEVMPLYTVTLSASTSEGGSVSGGGVCGSGSDVTVVATANSGYAFVNWTEDGVEVSTTASYTFAAATNRTLAAHFAPLHTIAVNAFPAGGGSASGGGAFLSGTNVTVVAATNSGYQFVAWTEDGEIVSTSSAYCFTSSFNRTLVAHFAPYPFIPPKGSYTGLFSEEIAGVSPRSSGSLALTVGARGAYSARLRLAGVNHAFSGQFDAGGRLVKTFMGQGTNSLTVVLGLDLLSGAERVTGIISNGAWAAQILGHRAMFDGKTNIAPQCGRYTIVIPGACGATNQPAGDGYGTLTVSKMGLVCFQGTLADGTRVSQSAPVSKEGRWPFHVSLSGGRGVLWSWLAFTNASELGGAVTWIKPEQKSGCYTRGFSVAAGAWGTRYQPPGRGTNVLGLAWTTNLTLTLQAGGLAQGLTNRIALSAANRVTTLSGPGLSLAFRPSNGGFGGSVWNPGTSKWISFGGVVLQGRRTGSGFFLNGTESGEIRMEP